jgi:hypothetical protein
MGLGPPFGNKMPKGAGVINHAKGAIGMSYWVVEAMWGGRDDQLETFVRRGCWFLGWSEEDEPAQNQLRD